jgi:hypothetical protein
MLADAGKESTCYTKRKKTEWKAVLWSRKYFFRLRLTGAANPNCGPAPAPDSFTGYLDGDHYGTFFTYVPNRLTIVTNRQP